KIGQKSGPSDSTRPYHWARNAKRSQRCASLVIYSASREAGRSLVSAMTGRQNEAKVKMGKIMRLYQMETAGPSQTSPMCDLPHGPPARRIDLRPPFWQSASNVPRGAGRANGPDGRDAERKGRPGRRPGDGTIQLVGSRTQLIGSYILV